MRLRRLHLRGFRTFPSTDLDLGDITLLVGPNDAGKSSILVAISCLLNETKPDGSAWTTRDVAPPRDVNFGDTIDAISVIGEFDELDERDLDEWGFFATSGTLRIGVQFAEGDFEGLRRGPAFVLDAAD